MAEEKKDAKKGGDKGEKKGGGGPNLAGDLEIAGGIIALLFLLYVVFYGVLKSFGVEDTNSWIGDKWEVFKTGGAHFLVQSINTLTFISIFLCLMFIMGAYYSKFRKKEIIDDLKYVDNQLMSQGNGKFSAPIVKVVDGGINLPGTSGLATVNSAGTEQWAAIEKYMQSHNPSDWRLAIIEADILLYDMLEQIGFQGDTIGDKLKSVDPASFTTLDDAWRAHKVRNLLAHEGASYELTYNDARKTIDSFKRVFDEFYFI